MLHLQPGWCVRYSNTSTPSNMLTVNLKPYQAEAVEQIQQHYADDNTGFILADEAGLGKGVQALAIAETHKKSTIGIVCPAFIKPKWIDELRTKVKSTSNSYYIYTYSQLRDKNFLSVAKKVKYDLLIIDEFHRCGDPTTQQTQAVMGAEGLTRACKKSLALSATPARNRVGELYPYLRSINHPLTWDGFEPFVRRWAKSCRRIQVAGKNGRMRDVFVHSGLKNDIYDLQQGIGSMLLRRRRVDVRAHIAEAERFTIPITLDASFLSSQKQILEQAGFTTNEINFLLNEEYFSAHLDVIPELQKFSRFKKALGHYKTPYVVRHMKMLIEERLSNGDNLKLVFYAHHKDILQQYYDELTAFVEKKRKTLKYKRPVGFYFLTGEVGADERFEQSKEANAQENAILFATMGAIPEGIDLEDFDESYFSELAYTPAVHDQLEGRIDRITSKRQSLNYYFVADSALEKHIMKLLEEKQDMHDRLLS